MSISAEKVIARIRRVVVMVQDRRGSQMNDLIERLSNFSLERVQEHPIVGGNYVKAFQPGSEGRIFSARAT